MQTQLTKKYTQIISSLQKQGALSFPMPSSPGIRQTIKEAKEWLIDAEKHSSPCPPATHSPYLRATTYSTASATPHRRRQPCSEPGQTKPFRRSSKATNQFAAQNSQHSSPTDSSQPASHRPAAHRLVRRRHHTLGKPAQTHRHLPRRDTRRDPSPPRHTPPRRPLRPPRLLPEYRKIPLASPE